MPPQPPLRPATDYASPQLTTSQPSIDTLQALNGTFKAELIHRRTWRTHDQVELAVVGWAGWYNHQRLHSVIGNVPPAEYEATYYRSINTPASTGAR
jgi:putative transposase